MIFDTRDQLMCWEVENLIVLGVFFDFARGRGCGGRRGRGDAVGGRRLVESDVGTRVASALGPGAPQALLSCFLATNVNDGRSAHGTLFELRCADWAKSSEERKYRHFLFLFYLWAGLAGNVCEAKKAHGDITTISQRCDSKNNLYFRLGYRVNCHISGKSDSNS